jgi:DNA primase
VNLLSELRGNGIEVIESTSGDGNEIRVCCPFCVEMGESPDFKYRLGINLASGLGHCFNCGWSSRQAVLMYVRKIGLQDGVVTEVLNTSFTQQTRERDAVVTLPQGFTPLVELDDDDPYLSFAFRYARKRGITRRQMREKEIGATADDYQYRGRIIFPVRMGDGKLAGFVTRDCTGLSSYKYLNKVGTKSVYNVRPDLYPHALLVLSEGIVKALAIERATRYKLCSSATLGNSITDYQMNQMKSFREIVLFPDPDKAGLKGFMGIAANLTTQFSKVSVAYPWPEQQADDLDPSVIREHLRNRRPYNMLLEWRMRMEIGGRR